MRIAYVIVVAVWGCAPCPDWTVDVLAEYPEPGEYKSGDPELSCDREDPVSRYYDRGIGSSCLVRAGNPPTDTPSKNDRQLYAAFAKELGADFPAWVHCSSMESWQNGSGFLNGMFCYRASKHAVQVLCYGGPDDGSVLRPGGGCRAVYQSHDTAQRWYGKHCGDIPVSVAP